MMAAVVLALSLLQRAPSPNMLVRGSLFQRVSLPRMSASDEAAAKAAWLAKLDEPHWGPATHTNVATGWLIPGGPVLTLEAADEMTNVVRVEIK